MSQLLPSSVGPTAHEEIVEPLESAPALKPEARPSPTAPDHMASPHSKGTQAPLRTLELAAPLTSGHAMGDFAPPPAPSYAPKPMAPAPPGPSGNPAGESPTPSPGHPGAPPPSAPLASQPAVHAGPESEAGSERWAESGLSGSASEWPVVDDSERTRRYTRDSAAESRARRRLKTLKPLPRGADGRLPPLSKVLGEARASGV